MATKSTAKPKTKKTASKTTKKAAPRKTAAKKAPATKSVKKAPTQKTAVKKTAAKKVAAKKTVTKKAAPTKKAPAKKQATAKAAPKPATAKKATAKKKTVKAAEPAKKATAKTATKKAAAKKTTTKAAKKTSTKAAAKKAAALAAPALKKPKPANVGQAPRKTTFAASIPVPTQIPLREAPEADEKSSSNAAASSSAKQDFKVNDQIVYPAHGVGRIVGLEKQEVASVKIELFVINFDQEKMRLRVPTGKAKTAGMRPLSSDKSIKDAITTLKGRARIKRTMWSRRAQEYDAKINSGDIKLVAEVVRDLYRAEDQPEQSYSERQLFEAALDRMAREVAAVRKADLGVAIEEIEASLRKKAVVT